MPSKSSILAMIYIYIAWKQYRTAGGVKDWLLFLDSVIDEMDSSDVNMLISEANLEASHVTIRQHD